MKVMKVQPTNQPARVPQPKSDRPSPGNTGKLWIIRIAFLGIVIGFWQLTITAGIANAALIGSPLRTGEAFLHQFDSSVVFTDLPYTLYETFIGFIIATIGGSLAGLLLSRNRLLKDAALPVLWAANSVPRIALAPLFILWFGLGATGKIAIVISFVFFVMLSTTMAALTQPNQDFELLSASLGATSRQQLMYFILPAAVPTLAVGLELSLTYSFLGAVAGEIVGGSHGLGVRLTEYANAFELNRFLAVLILLALISTSAVQIIRRGTAPLTRWHAAEQRDGGYSQI